MLIKITLIKVGMNKQQRLTIQLIAAVILVVVGIGLLIASFIVPPLGIIHSSVLAAYGEVSAFAGSLFGIDYTYRYKILKNDTMNK